MTGNVDFVRRIYEDDLLDRHVERILERCHPDVELINPGDAVEAGARRGHEVLRAVATTAWSSFSWYDHALRRLYGGEEVVVAAVTFRARGHGSGIEVEQEEAHSWTFRDGQIVRFEWGRDLAAALVAAGVPAKR